MIPSWLKTRLADSRFSQARSLTASLLVCMATRLLVMDQRMIVSSSMQPTLAIGDRVLLDKASFVFGRFPGHSLDLRRNDIIVFKPPTSCRSLFFKLSGVDARLSDRYSERLWEKLTRRRWREFKRTPLNKSLDFTKRVVALSGDRVAVVKGHLYVNGQAADLVAGAAPMPAERSPRSTQRLNSNSNSNSKQGSEDYHQSAVNRKASYSLATIVVPEDHVWVLGDNRDKSFDSHVWGPLPMQNVIGCIRARYWPIYRAAWFRREYAPSMSNRSNC